MKKTSDFKVGQTVEFGRRSGEKTLGRVIKVNRKSLKVETLEARGRTARGQSAGMKWNVHPSLCTLVSASKALPKPGALVSPLIEQALAKLTPADIAVLRIHFQKR